jgi:20S proteasome alpha/beta subunit
MSLAIVTTTTEGIVIAADSRQSYRSQRGMARIGSDSAQKVFQLNDRLGVAITGLAFLPENEVQKSLSKFVDEFKSSNDLTQANVSQTADSFHKFLDAKYNYREQLKKIPDQIRADLSRQGFQIVEVVEQGDRVGFKFKDQSGKEQQGTIEVDRISFLMAGYNPDKSYEAYTVSVPGKKEEKRSSTRKGFEYGADWIGQVDVLNRIILGFDHRIVNIPAIQQLIQKNENTNVLAQLRGLEYVIQWGTMTLKDAVDFCMLAINTTAAIQRFSDGIAAAPGDIPGVGGPIDIAIITPEKGFQWIARKQITAL